MDFTGFFLLMGGIWFGPPVIFFIIAAAVRKNSSTATKVLSIIGVAWILVGGGICATLLTG